MCVSDLSRQQKYIRCLANLLNIEFILQEQWQWIKKQLLTRYVPENNKRCLPLRL